jgi:sigma-B regulation protein RsbU (phosphoserine phosphatase)
LANQTISRTHARIVTAPDGYLIEDLNSRHGVYINGERTSRKRLAEGDQIELGRDTGFLLEFAASQRDADPLTRLREVLEIARSLERDFSPAGVLESVVDAALEIAAAERGFLFLRRGDSLEMAAARDRHGRPLDESSIRVPRRMIAEALEGSREAFAVNFEDPGSGTIDPGQTVMMLDLRSSIFVPLPRAGGVLYFDSRADRADLTGGGRELLETLALQATTVIETARSIEADRARRSLEGELALAREIQQNLLPGTLPVSDWLVAAGSSRPSRAVGGDYFDLIPQGPDSCALVMADVSGKGVGAALLASLLQGALVMADDGIASVFARLNRFLHERTGGERYATMFYAHLHRDGSLKFANAGHNPPVVMRASGKMETLDATGVPLGLLDDSTHEVHSFQLYPGDTLVAYSDGFSESVPRHALRNAAGATIQEIHDSLFSLCDCEPNDDQTLLVVQFQPESLRPA